MKHLPAIDGLRAVAVLAVVAYHAGLGGAGFVGVDVFFVISGYLITRLLADELRSPGRIDFMHFYARRARRILPAAILVVAVTLALSFALLPTGEQAVAESAAAAGVFVANLFFQSATGDYWSDSAEMMPLLHLWSLSVEEQFYLLWPVLLIAVRRNPGPWLWGVAIASFALAEALLWFNPTAAFYQMPARAWELAAGGLVAVGALRIPQRAALPGLLLTLAACAYPLPHFPGIGALPAVAGSLLVIGALHSGARLPALELRPVAYIGLISYSLYLWHWPLLALDRALRVGESPLTVRLALCAVAFVLAAMSYRYVEQPFRRARVRHGRAVAAGAVCAVALSVTAFAMAAGAPKPAPRIVAKPLACAGDMQLPRCLTSEPKLVLWGDSYASSWEPFAVQVAKAEGLPATMFVKTYCPPTAGEAIKRRSAQEERECRAHNDRALAYLKAHGADTLVIAAFYADFFNKNPGHPGLRQLVQEVAPHVRRILIVGPTPGLRDDPRRCVALGEDCALTRAEFEGQAHNAMLAMRELQGVEVIDAATFFCDGDRCPGSRDGVALYADQTHVSPEGAALFARSFLSQ